MATTKTGTGAKGTSGNVTDYRHGGAKRKNIPPAGLEAQGVLPKTTKILYEYNPHLPPILRSAAAATEADRLPQLLAIAGHRALSPEEVKLLANALRRHEPWLEWSGKREKPWFEVDPVALHMHERISTQAVLRVLAREDIERNLFGDSLHDYGQAVQFYQHDVDWANRMILGDSLQVMASLARREDLMGNVQMIYFDPPYGIKFSSNFQPELGQLDVGESEEDLTREPEMVKAYRDTWTLGIHSYLAYLRDRFAMAKELLADTGSIFVQIGAENLHRVRCLMDEVFGPENCCAIIAFVKTSGVSQKFLPDRFDHLIWFAKNKDKAKYRQVYLEKSVEEGTATNYSWVELSSSMRRGMNRSERDGTKELEEGSLLYKPDNITSQGNPLIQFEHFGKPYSQRWKTNLEGLKRLSSANRMHVAENSLQYVRYLSDFEAIPVTKLWSDTATGNFTDEKIYIVQTGTKTIERCILMTTDPGDLVLDPTCGSGTTAYVAEQWGRRWITCDTSRVALVLAKHRLMTAVFDYYRLRPLSAEDVARNPHGTWLTDTTGTVSGKATFKCKTLPHIMLKSIARNISLDPIFAKHEPILSEKLGDLNTEVARVSAAIKEKLVEKLIAKHRKEGANAVTEADARRWLLPSTQAFLVRSTRAKKPLKGVTPKQAEAYRNSIPEGLWKDWEVPFDVDDDWPKGLQDALAAYRIAWRAKMNEVNACIAANVEAEELVDKPEEVKGLVRVSGPFTMEGVISVEDGPNSPIGGASDELDTFDGEVAVANAEAHLDKIIRLLKVSGVDFPDNKNMKFSRLDALIGVSLIHAEGDWANEDQKERRVAVSVGPEVGNVSAMQVEDVIRDANRRGYDDLVFAGFGFDAAAQDAIEGGSHPKLRLHMALIRPDVIMGDLLKTQPGSQLFTIFSAPRVKGPTPQEDGEFMVEVEGMDVYDPVSNTLFPTDRKRIAAWFVDTDYDGRTFCICQAFMRVRDTTLLFLFAATALGAGLTAFRVSVTTA